MIRTRDFALFLVAAAFLLVGIGVTGLTQFFASTAPNTVVQFKTDELSTSSAETIDIVIDRQQRLTELRAKIADRGDVITSPTEVIFVEDTSVTELEDVDEDEVVTSGVIQNCSTVTTVTRPWPAAEIVSLEREGRRVYLTETSQDITTQVGTTTTIETIVSEDIFTHLPIRSRAGQVSCIGQDVIGIAQDGSLLRNDNYAAYSIFGSETLIGYALDGLPIYGLTNNMVTDVCGGVTIDGQYRYYLSSERPGMLGCFAASPVTL